MPLAEPISAVPPRERTVVEGKIVEHPIWKLSNRQARPKRASPRGLGVFTNSALNIRLLFRTTQGGRRQAWARTVAKACWRTHLTVSAGACP